VSALHYATYYLPSRLQICAGRRERQLSDRAFAQVLSLSRRAYELLWQGVSSSPESNNCLFQHCLGSGSPASSAIQTGRISANWVCEYLHQLKRLRLQEDQSFVSIKSVASAQFASWHLLLPVYRDLTVVSWEESTIGENLAGSGLDRSAALLVGHWHAEFDKNRDSSATITTGSARLASLARIPEIRTQSELFLLWSSHGAADSRAETS